MAAITSHCNMYCQRLCLFLYKFVRIMVLIFETVTLIYDNIRIYCLLSAIENAYDIYDISESAFSLFQITVFQWCLL
jgi:hypothetical protein